jgi:hypothetical protein
MTLQNVLSQLTSRSDKLVNMIKRSLSINQPTVLKSSNSQDLPQTASCSYARLETEEEQVIKIPPSISTGLAKFCLTLLLVNYW